MRRSLRQNGEELPGDSDAVLQTIVKLMEIACMTPSVI